MAAAALPQKLAGRYEIKEVLGQGGMGLVYRAYDCVIRRDVALKTLRDVPEPAALQLFHKECDVLASMSHPNIVEIFDIGEFEEGGQKKPYFVMPLLPGTTLDNLIRGASHRLTVDRTLEIMTQCCRGLHAAHERGLVHRDLKPSNIFVMADDSVKIIDFGVAHITNAASTLGQKGTLLYMSPEQIEMKPLSAQSDIFSLSVVCYETLTGRHPFRRTRQDEIVTAILHEIPPPVHELNAAVNQAISRTIHKGMAKQSWNRFSSAREFADTLTKAFRNEPIECFDSSRIRPRVQRAGRALQEGDYQFAAEIISELAAEGHLDSSIDSLRQQVERGIRAKTIAQLLESAKARFEEEEDPLALQKLQQVLEMEPDNGAALAMKKKIEERRSARQIESWYRLAEQHAANHSYAHAREALENVLQLKPKETRALQLLDDIDSQEHEYNKLRQDKAQLHQAALSAWQKGDVSSALTKLAMVLELDRRAPDSSNPERSATYQSLYNQIRSEHDAMNNAYAEARKVAADHNFAKALSVCDAWLLKYPGNALFQALKFDIEEQQRQEFSTYVASIDRRVDGEPDLEKRVNILKEALVLYPGETHFEKALRLTSDKRDLVDSIVARARLHEEQSLFAEALGDWEILRNIYSEYPGLKFEVERVLKRREQQKRMEARAGWIDKIDGCMQSSDYPRALDLLQKAESEFPGDAELQALGQAAREGLQRAAEAQNLMARGQELCSENDFQGGLDLLRKAYALDDHNRVTRAVLADALADQATAQLDHDWATAERLAQEALNLNALHAAAKSVRTLALDKKREQFVDECIARARRLQAAADTARALECVEQGLGVYGSDLRLQQLRETLQKEAAESRRRLARAQDLAELQLLEQKSEIGAADATVDLAERTITLAARYPDDPEFSTLSSEIQRRLNSSSAGIAQGPAAAPMGTRSAPNATLLFSSPSAAPAPELAATSTKANITRSLSFQDPGPASPIRAAQGRPAAAITDFYRKLVVPLRPVASAAATKLKALTPRYVGVIASGVVLMGFLLIVGPRLIHRPRPTTSIAEVMVSMPVRTVPAGAVIRVNSKVEGSSNVDLKLPPGHYQIEAELSGYQKATRDVDLSAGSSSGLDISLEPLLSSFHVSSDSGNGSLSFDNEPEEQLKSGQWVNQKISPGEHKVKFSAPAGDLSFAFTTGPSTLPLVKGGLVSNRLHAIVVSNFKNQARVYSTFLPAQLTLDQQQRTAMSPDGIELDNLSPGTHELNVSQDNDQHTFEIDLSPAPTITAFVGTDQNVGSLLVVAGEDDAQVFIDGKPYKRLTQAGELRIHELEPKEYTVRVAKKGFDEVTEQHVKVRRGGQSHVVFTLTLTARPGSLVVRGGIPDTEVLVDQVLLGMVRADGSFQNSTITAGEHDIELRKENFKPVRLKKNIAAGATLTLAEADVALKPVTGELKITFLPADAIVTVSRFGQSPIAVTSGTALSLPPGMYSIAGHTASGPNRSVNVQIVSGRTVSADLPLASAGMSTWNVPGGWRTEKGWYVRRGGDFALYNALPSSGTFSFSAMMLKGKKLQWVLNYVDERSYELFQMDEKFFYRSRMTDGKVIEATRIPVSFGKKEFRTLQIQVSAGQVLTRVLQAGNWVQLDSLTVPGTDLSLGKFGFLIQGSDEMALTNFEFFANARVLQ